MTLPLPSIRVRPEARPWISRLLPDPLTALCRRLGPPALWPVTFAALAGLMVTPARAQYNEGAGIETVGSDSIRQLTITRTIFEGQCPGQVAEAITGYFVRDDLLPRQGLTLRLTNLSRGLSPDAPPYTLRTYDKGRASQSFDITLGDRHRGSYFVVREGRNLMQYEISESANVVASGSFTIDVQVPTRYRYRWKKPVEITKYTSDGKPYRTIEYRCP